MSKQQLDPEIYDDEAFVGLEEGELLDGKVVDDLNDEDAEGFEEEEDSQSDGEDEVGERGTMAEGDATAAEADAEAAEPLPDASMSQLTHHRDAVMVVAWSPDGQRVVTGGCDDKAFVCDWRPDAQGSAVELAGHTDTIAAAAFDPTGATVATGGMDGSIRLWNSQTGEQQACLEGPSEAIEWLAWHPKGTVLLAGSEDMMAWMFNAAQQQVMQVFTGHAGPVSAGGFMPDGKAVVTAGGDGDGCIKTWNPKTGACTATIAAGHLSHSPDGVTCLAFAGDGSTVVSGGVDGSVVVSNIASGKRVAHVQEHADSVEGVAFANGLPLVVTASMDGKVIIWDTNAASKRGTCEHPEGVVHLAMQHRGPLFATACLDGVVRVFDVRTAQTVATFGGNSAAVQCVAWAPDDVHLLSGSDDHTARVFECPA